MAAEWNIMLGIPHSGTITWGAAQGVARASQKHHIAMCPVSNSALAHGFNQILAIGLNGLERGDVTHLAMLHADIDPQDSWLDILADEMEDTGAEFLSVVNAIKDGRGVTSTGISKPGDDWYAHRRFTVREILEMPETFDAAEAGYPGDVLLHNTGCWLLDLRAPWLRRTNAKGELLAFFTLNDRIYRDGDAWQCQFEPEDWFFSRRLHEAGAKAYATRKVRTSHLGVLGYVNNAPWGQYLEGDEDTAARWRQTKTAGPIPIEDESGNCVGCATFAQAQEPELCLTP